MIISNDKMAADLFRLDGQLAFEKVGKEYLIYCFICNRYKKVSKEKWQQIRRSKVCPVCGYDKLRITIRKEIVNEDWLRYGNFGYWVSASWKFGEHPEADEVKFVADWSDGRLKVLGIVKYMTSLYFNNNSKWRKVRKDNYYSYCFYKVSEGWSPGTLKKYYEDLLYPFKSNQITLIKNGVYNHNQMKYIYLFDLKSDEKIKEYDDYIQKNRFEACGIWDVILNEYYLDYLVKNNISLRDYWDYVDDCKTLGFKYGKPKNFQEEHMRLNRLIEITNEEKTKKKIIERKKELVDNEATVEDIEFKTFDTLEHMLKVADDLHNCMARSYSHIYAEGKCDLYFAAKNGKPIIAIEVKNSKVIQAREDHNKEVNDEWIKLIKKWAELKGFAYGV
jgi:hypothetical protein